MSETLRLWNYNRKTNGVLSFINYEILSSDHFKRPCSYGRHPYACGILSAYSSQRSNHGIRRKRYRILVQSDRDQKRPHLSRDIKQKNRGGRDNKKLYAVSCRDQTRQIRACRAKSNRTRRKQDRACLFHIYAASRFA